MFRRIIATSPTWVTLPLRLTLAAVFVAHGAQKVLGSWEGPGFSKFISFPAPYPFMKPSWLWMGAAAISELVGGVLMFFGLLTRVGAFFLACTMLVAVIGVHWPIFFASNKGFEYPLALLAMCLALLISGGGIASVDLALSSSRGGGRRR
jgi:putative oxidoreductase